MTHEEKQLLKTKLDEMYNNVSDDIGHYEYYEAGYASGYIAALTDVESLIANL